jgi:hypothetical protein
MQDPPQLLLKPLVTGEPPLCFVKLSPKQRVAVSNKARRTHANSNHDAAYIRRVLDAGGVPFGVVPADRTHGGGAARRHSQLLTIVFHVISADNAYASIDLLTLGLLLRHHGRGWLPQGRRHVHVVKLGGSQ